jgi:uncharacterized repeat protein (TIGR02543 family)
MFHPGGPKSVHYTPEEPNYYTVSFNADGGSPATQTKTVQSGASIGSSNMPVNPTKSGYSFTGWYTAANSGGSEFTGSTTVTGDITVYARWSSGTPTQYTVTFDADGGSPATQTKTVASGASIGASNMPANPTKSGYGFDGWYTVANSGGSEFTAATTVTGNITVYARWSSGTPNQYTITFDADGGSPATQTKTVANGGSVGASNMPTNPTKSGYGFDGWYTLTGGNGDQFTGSTTVTASITVYAKWTIDQYTVTFDADGGSPATQTKTVASGGSVGASNMPNHPTKGEYTFGGWYTSQNGDGTEFTATTTVTGTITVYAKWIVTVMPTTSLQSALEWLDLYAVEGGDYTITPNALETIAPRTLSYSGKQVRITMRSDDTERTVLLSANGTLFTVGSGVTLTLDNNITLQGRSNNTVSLVRVGGGTLVMNTGATIMGNRVSTTPSANGGGVYVAANSTFTMNGGTISGNSAYSTASSATAYSYGGGVYVLGTFTMNGGTISGNTASASRASSTTTVNAFAHGGGVYVANNGTFTLSDGTISSNSATRSNTYPAPAYGGGVFIATNGTFTLSGGTISGNSASSSSGHGGGVFANGMFTMSGGEISGNTGSSSGGGVDVSGGTFIMSDGTISGNTGSNGGGVYVNSGSFIKQSNGIIYGSNASSGLKNTANGDNYGHAVYVYDSSSSKKRNTTAGTGVTLNSATTGSAGGWE